MKSVWFPAITSLIVIIFSVFIIKPNPSSPTFQIPSPTPVMLPLPAAPTAIPTKIAAKPTAPDNDIAINDDYLQVYIKCGELPLLPDYSETRFRGDYSARLWSPGCRFIAWSATIKNSFGPWELSPYEGLFIYDLKTQKVTRIYAPLSESDTVRFLRWQDDTHLIFHLDLNSADYLYNMSIKTYSQL